MHNKSLQIPRSPLNGRTSIYDIEGGPWEVLAPPFKNRMGMKLCVFMTAALLSTNSTSRAGDFTDQHAGPVGDAPAPPTIERIAPYTGQYGTDNNGVPAIGTPPSYTSPPSDPASVEKVPEIKTTSAASPAAQGNYVTAMAALIDKYQLDSLLLASDADSKMTQGDFCNKIGSFLDNEKESSGSDFAFEDSPRLIKTGLNFANPEDFVKNGLITINLYKILFDRMTGEETGREVIGPFQISVKDIPFLLYCFNKSAQWADQCSKNNLSDGVRKEIGTSDTGTIKATFIYNAGKVGPHAMIDLTIGSGHFYSDDPQISGQDLITWLRWDLDRRIDKARADYQEQMQNQKSQQSALEKLQADQKSIDNILK